MGKLAGIGVATFGAVGVLLCVTAICAGWLTAARIADGIDRAVVRLEDGLAKTDACLARAESRVSAVRMDLEEVHESAETFKGDDLELLHVRVAVDRLLERLGSSLERVDAIAESVRSFAALLRAAVEFAEQVTGEPETALRARKAADAIDRAAEVLSMPSDRMEALRTAAVIQMIHGLGKLVEEAVAGTEALVEGLADLRAEIAVARNGTVKYRNAAVLRVYGAAAANTLAFSWAGLGQVCLFNWGRRRLAHRIRSPS